MKTLLLMRHAKSSWKENKLKDQDRPINKRGQKNAPRMGELLEEVELVPQLIMCSTALRARQTAEAVIAKSGFTGKIEYLDAFYMAEAQVYLDAVHALPDLVERVLFIGHNPGLEACLQILSGQVEGLPTGAIAYITLPVNHWWEINAETRGDLQDLWRPRDFK